MHLHLFFLVLLILLVQYPPYPSQGVTIFNT